MRLGPGLGAALPLGLLLTFAALDVSQPATEAVTGPAAPVTRSYFGLHMHRAAETTTWPAIPFGSWRLWDAHVSWPFLEPRRDEWRFEKLDRYVALSGRHDVDLVLPLGLSPAWASARPLERSAYGPGFAAEPDDLARWREYVRAVAERYRGRIRIYEIWNEPNLKSFFSGGVEEMLSLCREAYSVLKSADSSIVVVSPSPTDASTGPSWLEAFLRGGGADCADVIGYHFYVAPRGPEAMVPLIRKVRRIMRTAGVEKPVWNTEAGWMVDSAQRRVTSRHATGLYSRVLSGGEAAGYVARAHILNWAYGVERLYWYAWDNHEMGLIEADGRTLKPPAEAYARIQTWLTGARISSCASDPADTWVCERRSAADAPSWIVWNPSQERAFRPPAEWRVGRMHPLLEEPIRIARGAEIRIGPMPVLLEPVVQR